MIIADGFCPHFEVSVGSMRTIANLILLKIKDFGIILGMDWLQNKGAMVD